MGKVIYPRKGEVHVAPDPLACLSATLNDNSWEQIRAASDAGIASTLWKVGDTKTIIINGQVGVTRFSNLSIDVFIIGFDHNAELEGANRIHFKIGKINGSHVSLIDSAYGNNTTTTGYFTMNPSYTNKGGWKDSYMRTTLLGNNGTPSSPPSNSLLAALPLDLLAVMKEVVKYSDNTGGGANNASYVTATTDYLFLLSEFELHGSRSYANSYEKNSQAQYDYYKAGNDRSHYKYNAVGTVAYTFCRSVYAAVNYAFCRVTSSSSAHRGAAYDSLGIAPAFCV